MMLPDLSFVFTIVFLLTRNRWIGGAAVKSRDAMHAFTPPRSISKDTTTQRPLSTTTTSSSSSPIPPPPPLSFPVWSLATPSSILLKNDDQAMSPTTSMNIVTFASAVSVAAPKYWMISLYYDTLTKDSFCAKKEGVLQLLTPSQKDLVPILGKRSGYDKEYSKQAACREAGMAWVERHELTLTSDDDNSQQAPQTLALLPHCASYLHVKLQSTADAGDHLVTICELIGTGVWNDNKQTIFRRSPDAPVAPMDHSNVLYTGLLRRDGIIS